MTTNSLEASVRPNQGKGPCRRLRAEGKMPAVAYGDGMAATPLAVSPKALAKLLAGEHGLNTEVKLELTGKPEGVTLGGELHQVFRKLPVRCRPAQIPVKLVHDVTSLGLDTVAHVKDLKLPEGLEILLPPERTVAAVVTAKKRQ